MTQMLTTSCNKFSMSFIHEYQVIVPILYKIPALNIERAVKLKKHTLVFDIC